MSALVTVVALAALTAAGIVIENIFSITGSTIANTMKQISASNQNSTSEQQSEIANATAEIAAGTVSAACLAAMNNDATNMANNNATCVGLGYSIAPPPSPIKTVFSQEYPIEVSQNGRIYMSGHEGSTGYSLNSTTSTHRALWFYNDGFMDTGGYTWYDNSGTLYKNATASFSSNGEMIYTSAYVGSEG